METGYGDQAYFGMTHRDAVARLEEHFDHLKRGIHTNQYIQNYYNLKGPDQIYTGIVIECDDYYLNTLEKAYIWYGNTNRRNNPEGWNKSGGGEGAKKHLIPYSFVKDETIHQGDDLLQFLKIDGSPEPSGFIGLLDGRTNEYNGYKIY
ncbi:hypothetical protein [Pelagicoccus sp. SDUM812003]|uniref:hypothetical protein n=1 Tax=Pelagicoccus sp. SDUM812003 TaxID=3041267 RepID=UPI0028124662|nr:hypothetical protein [Pelagicoccus sp. SDUM812003]